MIEQRTRKRKSSIFVLLILVLSGVVLSVLLIPSSYKNGLEELNSCSSVDEVSVVWEKYKKQLGSDHDFENEVRNKLTQFSPSNAQVDSCLKWLPETPTYLNLIVVPDIADRLRDSLTRESLKKEDVDLLKATREAFRQKVGKRNTKDIFNVVLPCSNHLDSSLKQCINELYLNMEIESNSPSDPFFTAHQKTKFNKNIEKLYDLSQTVLVNKDFQTFFNNTIRQYLKHSNIYARYMNKIVILTDGEIASNDEGISQGVGEESDMFEEANTREEIIQIIREEKLINPAVKTDLFNAEVMVCQIDFGQEEEVFQQEVRAAFWVVWLEQMNANSKIIVRNIPEQKKIEQIRDFIQSGH